MTIHKKMMGFVSSYIRNFKFAPFFLSDEVAFATPAVYAVLVLLGVQAMKTRNPFQLKAFSVVHSTFLCLLSLVMFGGILYGALIKAMARKSLFCLFCDSAEAQEGVLPFWITVYWLSKV